MDYAIACRAPLSMGFLRQENWSGLHFLLQGNLLDLGIEPVSPALAGRFFTTEPSGKSVPGDSDLIGLGCGLSLGISYIPSG